MPPSEAEGKAERVPLAGSRTAGWISLAVAAVWIGGLIVMAFSVSNPVLLNRRQVLRAFHEGLIVRARVTNLDAGECEAMATWPAVEIAGTLQVTDLDQTPARPGGTYLLPLLRTDAGYVIVPSRLHDGLPLIYPDTDEAIAQLEALLAE